MGSSTIVYRCALAVLLSTSALGAVLIPTVTVGGIANEGELSGEGAGGYGFDRICGAVAYEYQIGRFEVTAAQYVEFLNAVAATDTYGLYHIEMPISAYGCKIERHGDTGCYTYTIPGDMASRPVNFVSWGDAARFANWLHNGQPIGSQGPNTTEDGSYALHGATNPTALAAISRRPDATWVLPTEDEWYKAAYYDPAREAYFDYPTSSDIAPGQDMDDLTGNNANYWTDPFTHPIDGDKFTTIAGEFENSPSPYGTFDQAGNVSEWVEQIIYGTMPGVRGGCYSSEADQLHAASRAYGPMVSQEFYYLGFRVALVPEPSCGAGAIVLVMFACRRR